MSRSYLLPFLTLVAALAMLVPVPAEAQYFGRNKVQYDRFDFQVLTTDHYNLHFYAEGAGVMDDVARMAERWYERLARILEHEIRDRRPLIFYANHPDFQQTNVLEGRIGEGTGGVTEGLRDRIIMPLGSSYADTDHVLGHELVHSFQFDIAQGRQASGLQGLMRLPLWYVEGMAEYLSVGGESSLTGMWMRDALLHDEFPTLQQMSRDRRYFPYRFGHAFWAYVGGVYGDPAVAQMLRISVREGWSAAASQVLGVDGDTLSAQWKDAVVAHYGPLMEGRTSPGEAGALLLSPETGAGEMNVAPSLSPDGRYVAFLSEKDLFTVELFVADALTGEVIRSLTRSTRDAHFDALRFIDSSGAWSPDGERIAISVFAGGRNRIEIYRVSDGARLERIRVPEAIGEIRSPAFSPNGERIAFSGQAGGVTDIFEVEVASGEVRQLTDDRHAALQPTYSPDGRTIAFVTDRGPRTDFDRLTFGPMSIGLLDIAGGTVTRLAPLGDAAHWNPQFTPDGREIYFLADPDGFRDIYRAALDGSSLVRVTDIVTGVSGITHATPALTVARESGTVAFSVFDRSEFHIYSLDGVEAGGDRIEARQVVADAGRRLPGTRPGSGDRVETLLANAEVGLPAAGTYSVADATPVDRGLGLDWIGQPTIGAGVDQFGTFLAGSIAASFSDILGNRSVIAGVQAQGELKDLGGQIFYQDIERRWNWGAGISHTPYRFAQGGFAIDPATGDNLFIQETQRVFISQALARLQYPFSTVRRLEGGFGYTRQGFGIETDIFLLDGLGNPIGHRSESGESPDALHLGDVSAAFVGDNSFFGFSAPVRGWRYRAEVSQTVGSIGFTQLTGDYRRYFAPLNELTLAVRGFHLGRYGSDLEGSVIRPLFLGGETFVRGYSAGSFRQSECTPMSDGACAEFDRLLGHRLGVASLEARVPLLGTDRMGILSTPLFPVDVIAFVDGGVAWSAGDGADFTFDTETTARVPVFSTGVGIRPNLFGAFILEVYYAKPWQRPGRGSHFGLRLGPGW